MRAPGRFLGTLGIRAPADLAVYPRSAVAAMRGIGPARLAMLDGWLAAAGLAWATEASGEALDIHGYSAGEVEADIFVSMLKKASEGSVSACGMVLGLVQARRKELRGRGAAIGDLSPLRRLVWLLQAYQETAEAETGIARVNALKAIEGILETLAKVESEAVEPERDLTPAERLLAITQAAPAMSDEEMEVVVREWLGRRKLVLEVSESGEVSLVRRAVRLVV